MLAAATPVLHRLSSVPTRRDGRGYSVAGPARVVVDVQTIAMPATMPGCRTQEQLSRTDVLVYERHPPYYRRSAPTPGSNCLQRLDRCSSAVLAAKVPAITTSVT